ncbi:MAG: thymidine kinase, partial [Anaerolineae bacterium]|nr:thymidine kinase [Anaerolineae bacterium]
MRDPSNGRVEVICGSMFSGKTEELIRRVRRAQIARQKVQVFKPSIDTRYATERVSSHNGMHWDAIPVDRAERILELVEEDTTVVAIDE